MIYVGLKRVIFPDKGKEITYLDRLENAAKPCLIEFDSSVWNIYHAYG